jgi:hypothetical protein
LRRRKAASLTQVGQISADGVGQFSIDGDTERYGNARLEAACTRALAHASPFYRTVKTILVNGYDQQPLPAELGSSTYAGNARFVREAASLFHPEREPLIN